MYEPGTKWADYPGDTLYLWNGDVLYTAHEDSVNVLESDKAEGYKDSWVVDIYSLSNPDWLPQGGQWMESEYISDMNYTIEGITNRLIDCDLWKDDWTILDPNVGEIIKDLFEKCQEKDIKITALKERHQKYVKE